MQVAAKVGQKKPRTYYELSESQVSTPFAIVELYWDILKKYRQQKFNKVLDLGAGDARFSHSDFYEKYIGIEIDPEAAAKAKLNDRSELILNCAFKFSDKDFDACIGNPPYVRHHDVESPWKEETAKFLGEQLNYRVNGRVNLFAYFIALGLLKTTANGLVAMVIPYEWVSRPSYKSLRELITQQNWKVDIYCFKNSIFNSVLTTACITIIDKSQTSEDWNYFDINEDLSISERKGISGTGLEVLSYSKRKDIWAKRGLSPGSQKIFTLTDGQRIHYGLTLDDVVPCVTTLKYIPQHEKILNIETFKKYYIEAGNLCWLIKSNDDYIIGSKLAAYLESIPVEKRQTYTCLNQEPWYNFEKFTIPDLLIHSGFTSFGPKVLINEINAITIGSVMGVYSEQELPLEELQNYILSINFEEQIVAHSNNLKKIEVKQMNTILNEWNPNKLI